MHYRNLAATAPQLGSVSVPIVRADIDGNLVTLFELWNDSRFFPALSDDEPKPALLVVVNSAPPEDLARIAALFATYPSLAACFSGIHPVSANLSGDQDLYLREANPRSRGAYGSRAGPNFLFFETMRQAAGFGGYTLQIEVDCLPVQAGWLDATHRVLQRNAGSWVIGSSFAGSGLVNRDISLHLNGNALYHAGDERFTDFVETVWKPRLLEMTNKIPSIAYDCWWSYERAHVEVENDNASWQLVRTYDCQFRNDPFVVNLLDQRNSTADFLAAYDRYARLGRIPIFFHGPMIREVAATLLEHRTDSMIEAIDRLDPPATPRDWVWPVQKRREHGEPANQVEHSPAPAVTTDAQAPVPVLLTQLEIAPTEHFGLLLSVLAARLALNPDALAALSDDERGQVLARLESAAQNHQRSEKSSAAHADLIRNIGVSLLNK